MAKPYILYAMTHSLYSGRARSYLIKHQIPFQELSTGHESFKADVLPKGKLPTIPTLVTPEGVVIRDGGAIIEYFEAANGRLSIGDFGLIAPMYAHLGRDPHPAKLMQQRAVSAHR